MRTILLTTHLCFVRKSCKTGFYYCFFFSMFNKKLLFHYYCRILYERTSASCGRLLLREKYMGSNGVRKKRFDVHAKRRVRGRHIPATFSALYALCSVFCLFWPIEKRDVFGQRRRRPWGGVRRSLTKFRTRNSFFNFPTS